MSLEGKVKATRKLRGKINRLEILRGYSAYEVAVNNGFEGTAEEWLASLKGPKGDPGDSSALKVTITRSLDGGYGADTDPDVIQNAIDDNRTVVCYWHDKNIMLYPISFQSGGPYAFAAVSGATEYQVVIRDTDDIVCTVTKLSQEAILYTPQDLTPEQQAQARQNIGIDELPTGGGSGYRLIAKIVFDGSHETKYIKITQDMDGKPLELTKVLIYADWLAATSRADCNLTLNNLKLPWFFNLEQTAYKNILEAEMFDDLCYIHSYSKIAGTSKAEGSGVRAINIPELKINEIVWQATGVNPPPNGSTFAVYGY
jgi:hypothetical protein